MCREKFQWKMLCSISFNISWFKRYMLCYLHTSYNNVAFSLIDSKPHFSWISWLIDLNNTYSKRYFSSTCFDDARVDMFSLSAPTKKKTTWTSSSEVRIGLSFEIKRRSYRPSPLPLPRMNTTQPSGIEPELSKFVDQPLGCSLLEK